MAVNPAGPQPIFDAGIPRTVTVRASTGVTGGQLVFVSGVSNSISSGANSYVASDICIGGLASGQSFNGIVTTPGLTASGTNNWVSVAGEGMWLVTAAGTVIGGDAVYANGADAVIGQTTTVTMSGTAIGRAWSPAGSEGFTAVKFF